MTHSFFGPNDTGLSQLLIEAPTALGPREAGLIAKVGGAGARFDVGVVEVIIERGEVIPS
jgi:hypothetical protein